MRTFVLFALALTGTAILADDASAGPFRRNRGGSGNCCGTAAVAASPCCGGAAAYAPTGFHGAAYGGGYGVAATPCCGGGMTYAGGYPGGYPGGVIGGAPGATVGGKEAVIQATDGSVYTLGSDGH